MTPLFAVEKDPGVETELESGLKCLECIPACDETKYTISTTRLPLRSFLLSAATNSSRLYVLTVQFQTLGMHKTIYTRSMIFQFIFFSESGIKENR